MENKYTLITGASSGIGYELAKIFAKNNHNLILVARRNEKLQELKDKLQREFKITIHTIQKDLSQPNSSQEIFEETLKNNLQVEILVNNAGFGARGEFQKIDWTTQSQMIQLNIHTLTNLTHLFLPQMLKNKSGKILNVASVAAFFPGPYMAVYYASKSYVLSLSSALSEELAGTGVTVTSLCPGPTDSEFQKVANVDKLPMFNLIKIPSSQTVAEFAYRELFSQTKIAVYGISNKIQTFCSRLLPYSILAKIVKRIQR